MSDVSAISLINGLSFGLIASKRWTIARLDLVGDGSLPNFGLILTKNVNFDSFMDGFSIHILVLEYKKWLYKIKE